MKILLFGRLKELFQQAELTIELNQVILVSELRSMIVNIAQQKAPAAVSLLTNQVLFAINQEMANEDDVVKITDEVALLPPVTGG